METTALIELASGIALFTGLLVIGLFTVRAELKR